VILVEFFGGPWDGQLRQLVEAPLQLVAVVPSALWPVGDRAPAPLAPSSVTYRRQERRPSEAVTRYILERVGR
jgi:hypothetical protein